MTILEVCAVAVLVVLVALATSQLWTIKKELKEIREILTVANTETLREWEGDISKPVIPCACTRAFE